MSLSVIAEVIEGGSTSVWTYGRHGGRPSQFKRLHTAIRLNWNANSVNGGGEPR
jgi:hypothetical protein